MTQIYRLCLFLLSLMCCAPAADLRIKAGPTPDAVLLAEHPDKGFLRVYSTASANLEFKCYQGCVEARPKGGGEYLVILWPGEKNIVIKAAGYSPVTVTLPHEILAKEAFRVDVEGEDLSGSKGTGNLQINSIPSGALVEIEGVPMMQEYRTPISFPKMSAMSYKVLLSKDHYQPAEFKIEVLRDQTVAKNVELRLISGLVHFSSSTPNCQLSVDNHPRGECKQNLELLAGPHSVHLSAPAYVSRDLDLNVNQSEQYYSQDLFKQSGLMTIKSTPTGAKVYWLGEYLGLTPLNLRTEVGSGELRVEHLDYEDYEEQVNWNGGPLSKSINLSPKDSDHDSYPDFSDACPSAAEDGNGDKPTDGCPSGPLGMVSIPAGCFSMGSNEGENDEKPVHNVCLSAYNIDMHEVTQGEYSQVMGENPSSFGNCGANCPVEQVNWNQAQDYCHKVGKKLPTEAEWEYAARGGAASQGNQYSGSNNPDGVAWFRDNRGYKSHAVCSKQKNELGLCDMSGNVWEWTADWYGDYQSWSQQDPVGAGSGSYRVFRGGSWSDYTSSLRPAFRGGSSPLARGSNLGFRCAQSALDEANVRGQAIAQFSTIPDVANSFTGSVDQSSTSSNKWKYFWGAISGGGILWATYNYLDGQTARENYSTTKNQFIMDDNIIRIQNDINQIYVGAGIAVFGGLGLGYSFSF